MPPDTIGEIVIRSKYLTKGYWRNDSLTAAVLVQDDLHGPEVFRYHSGDRGLLNEDKRLTVLGRQDHTVKISGQKVDCTEIEQDLMGLQHVRECAVISQVDNRMNAYLVAYVVLEIFEYITDLVPLKIKKGKFCFICFGKRNGVRVNSIFNCGSNLWEWSFICLAE